MEYSTCHLVTIDRNIYGPRREKTCIRISRQSGFQTGLLSTRDYLEN